jgi:hypothetical protein
VRLACIDVSPSIFITWLLIQLSECREYFIVN